MTTKFTCVHPKRHLRLLIFGSIWGG